jgi:hypothetical protein
MRQSQGLKAVNRGLQGSFLQREEQEQGQRRNTGISPLRRQSAPPSVEMTFVWWVEREQATAKARATATDPYGMTNKMTNKRTGNSNREFLESS